MQNETDNQCEKTEVQTQENFLQTSNKKILVNKTKSSLIQQTRNFVTTRIFKNYYIHNFSIIFL